MRLQARSVSSESTFTLSSVSVRRFCHYLVVTAEKSPGSLRVPKPNTICLKDKSERDVILIKINLCWHSLGPVASAFFIACFDNVIKDGFRLLIKFSKLVRLPLRNFMDSSFVFWLVNETRVAFLEKSPPPAETLFLKSLVQTLWWTRVLARSRPAETGGRWKTGKNCCSALPQSPKD